jgi:hypothetical protein
LNGIYSGSLRLVLARILDGTDYFVKNSDDGIEVIVLGPPERPGALILVFASASSGTSARVVSSSAIAPLLTASSSLPPLASYLTDN